MKKKEMIQEKDDMPDLDCGVCIYRKDCDKAAGNSFCDRFVSRNYKPAREKPNEIWEAYQKDRFKTENKK